MMGCWDGIVALYVWGMTLDQSILGERRRDQERARNLSEEITHSRITQHHSVPQRSGTQYTQVW
jgi:hypothetical protein